MATVKVEVPPDSKVKYRSGPPPTVQPSTLKVTLRTVGGAVEDTVTVAAVVSNTASEPFAHADTPVLPDV
ncbi:MAG: hypothetical protein LLF97_04255 [Planctomycetaceae bacterium]|nr:hypothetical protein [Planctomycetaceae bacterium]